MKILKLHGFQGQESKVKTGMSLIYHAFVMLQGE